MAQQKLPSRRNADKGTTFEFESTDTLELNGEIDLQIGVYNRLVKDYDLEKLAADLQSRCGDLYVTV